MTVENWIELLVPIIGIVVAAVSAGLTYYFAKKQQIAADESRLKEKYYLNYIEAVSNIVVSDNSESAPSTIPSITTFINSRTLIFLSFLCLIFSLQYLRIVSFHNSYFISILQFSWFVNLSTGFRSKLKFCLDFSCNICDFF